MTAPDQGDARGAMLFVRGGRRAPLSNKSARCLELLILTVWCLELAVQQLTDGYRDLLDLHMCSTSSCGSVVAPTGTKFTLTNH